MYVERELEQQLSRYLDHDEVIALIGPRQVGKTTLLAHLYENLDIHDKNKMYLTFEDRSERRLFEDIEDFKDRYKDCQYLFIDEFQYASEGGQKLKYLYDTTSTKYIISGSSALDLTFKTGKYMVGRMFNFYLWPFSFREYLKFVAPELLDLLEKRVTDPIISFEAKAAFGEEINRRIEQWFHKYVVWGGYPAVLLAQDDSEIKQQVLRSIFDAYLLKEIKDLLSLATDEKLLQLTGLLATQIGGMVNYNELGNAVGLTYPKLKNHLQILRKTFVLETIRPFFSNKRTEIVKTPKVYFIDAGFRNYRLNDFRSISLRNDRGNLVENFVYRALQRRYFNIGNTQIKYWRTKNKAEVDFVIDRPGNIVPIEVKYSNNPTPGKSFYSFVRKYKPKKAYILTKGYTKVTRIEETEVYYVPVFYL